MEKYLLSPHYHRNTIGCIILLIQFIPLKCDPVLPFIENSIRYTTNLSSHLYSTTRLFVFFVCFYPHTLDCEWERTLGHL